MAVWKAEHLCGRLANCEYFMEENGGAVVPFSSCSRINPSLSRAALVCVFHKAEFQQQRCGHCNGMLVVKIF